MTVSELIAVLQRCPQDAQVVTTMSSLNRWLNAVEGVKLARHLVKEGDTVEDDTVTWYVCVDQAENTVLPEELDDELTDA